MSDARFVIDTTVLEDYYLKKLPNVVAWLDKIYAQDSDELIILNSILSEFARRTHYTKLKKDSLKNLISVLRRIPCVDLVDQDLQTIKHLIKNMRTFSKKPIIHFGEFTLIQESHKVNTVIVSSDKGALISYVNNYRLNPRSDPPMEIPKGTKYS